MCVFHGMGVYGWEAGAGAAATRRLYLVQKGACQVFLLGAPLILAQLAFCFPLLCPRGNGSYSLVLVQLKNTTSIALRIYSVL
jgi:hypothetical protein